MNTWIKQQKNCVGEKVIKLRDERHLLARSLVIQESRIVDLGRSFGTYEMAITQRSIFCNDGTLLTPNKKSSLTDLIFSK